MKILIIESFYTGSHKAWADQLMQYSTHDIELLSLKGVHWKWRMHGAAITLAQRTIQSRFRPDLVLVTDMLDLSTYISIVHREMPQCRYAIYFHENQLTYPWSKDDEDPQLNRDRNYAWINYKSALAADRVYFNSQYHHDDFLDALPRFLRAFPDYRNLDTIDQIETKSEILPLGLELSKLLHTPKTYNEVPHVLWNHRWEYDKNPEEFFRCLFELQQQGYAYKLMVLGQSYQSSPPIFAEAQHQLRDRIVHWGYTDQYDKYIRCIMSSDILPVTSRQDFFGISTVEGIAAGAIPLLPQRLAYRDYIPDDQYPSYYYHDYDTLVDTLGSWLDNWPNHLPSLRSEVKKYNWDSIISSYDQAFDNMMDSINISKQ